MLRSLVRGHLIVHCEIESDVKIPVSAPCISSLLSESLPERLKFLSYYQIDNP